MLRPELLHNPEDVMGRARDNAMVAIERAAQRGLFRERDLRSSGVWHSAFADAEFSGLVTRHGHGVWSHRNYSPTRYELVQIRFPKLVFWGPSALWLLGVEAHEPEALWIALGNKSRAPRTLDLSAVLIRTRNLEEGVQTVKPEKTRLSLRVQSRERAQADLSRNDIHRLLARAADRAQFALPRGASLLSGQLPIARWRPREDWVVKQSLAP